MLELLVEVQQLVEDVASALAHVLIDLVKDDDHDSTGGLEALLEHVEYPLHGPAGEGDDLGTTARLLEQPGKGGENPVLRVDDLAVEIQEVDAGTLVSGAHGTSGGIGGLPRRPRAAGGLEEIALVAQPAADLVADVLYRRRLAGAGLAEDQQVVGLFTLEGHRKHARDLLDLLLTMRELFGEVLRPQHMARTPEDRR